MRTLALFALLALSGCLLGLCRYTPLPFLLPTPPPVVLDGADGGTPDGGP